MDCIKNSPLISIIVPCYNVEKFIDQCISSIVAQTYSNLEILLVNDGSDDNTGVCCDMWQKKDNRIRVIHQQNQGPSNARKIGLECASGEFIAFVDADDWIEPTMIDRLYMLVKIENCDIVYCDADDFKHERDNGERLMRLHFDARNMNIEDVIINLIKFKFDCVLWNKLFKRELFNNILFPKFQQWEDAVICVQLFLKTTSIGYDYSVLYHHRISPDSLTFKDDPENILRRKKETLNNWNEIKKILSQHEDYYKYKEAIDWRLNNLPYQTVSILKKYLTLPKYFIPYGLILLYRLLKPQKKQ